MCLLVGAYGHLSYFFDTLSLDVIGHRHGKWDKGYAKTALKECFNHMHFRSRCYQFNRTNVVKRMSPFSIVYYNSLI